MSGGPRPRTLLAAQGTYYLATGVVPFVSRRAFQAVTGPKADWWLVQSVSVLVDAVGAGLVTAAVRDRVTPELMAVAAGSSIGLAAVESVHVLRGRIARVYLLDAALQAGFAAAGMVACVRRTSEDPLTSRA